MIYLYLSFSLSLLSPSVILTYVNCKKVRWATRVQDLLALTKVFALIVIIVVGLCHLFRGTTQNYEDPMEGTTTYPALLATTFYHTFYAYDGWDSLNDVMEELKDPIRNMPRAIAISVTCVIVIYTLTNVAYFAVLPKDLMLASPAVAVTFGNLTLGVMAWTIPVFVACSISGALNGYTITYSRLLFVSARRGHLPRLLSLVQIENNTPVTSLMFLTFMSMWMFVTSDVRVLINYMAFAGNLMHVVCISSFFWFRVKHPDWPRPIKFGSASHSSYNRPRVLPVRHAVVKQSPEVGKCGPRHPRHWFILCLLIPRPQRTSPKSPQRHGSIF
ncbi:Y+L amino acid transporter 2 [Chionoecetes opilio]|uniref:Y+L amino acid transporter 2 n=1 Tax=Chionoecetes opilio TaxID=41210 RepID=A0A8J4Y1B2_CHIOP|nr:Y+L amino acid transporter 2 [Chionoecetes opilio]